MTMEKFWVIRMIPSNKETGQKWLWKYSHLLDSLKWKRQIIFCAKTSLNFFLIRRLGFSVFTINMHASVLWFDFIFIILFTQNCRHRKVIYIYQTGPQIWGKRMIFQYQNVFCHSIIADFYHKFYLHCGQEMRYEMTNGERLVRAVYQLGWSVGSR